jgi:hypothetical protein
MVFSKRDDDLLCKFVVDSTGKKIGETITLEKDIVIIKSSKGFLGIPIKHLDIGETIVVKGLLDLDKAYEIGEEWLKNASRRL